MWYDSIIGNLDTGAKCLYFLDEGGIRMALGLPLDEGKKLIKSMMQLLNQSAFNVKKELVFEGGELSAAGLIRKIKEKELSHRNVILTGNESQSRRVNSEERRLICFIDEKEELLKLIDVLTIAFNELSEEMRYIVYYEYFKKMDRLILAENLLLSERGYQRRKREAIEIFANRLLIASLMKGVFIF